MNRTYHMAERSTAWTLAVFSLTDNIEAPRVGVRKGKRCAQEPVDLPLPPVIVLHFPSPPLHFNHSTNNPPFSFFFFSLFLLFTYFLLSRFLFDFTCSPRRLPSAVLPALLPLSFGIPVALGHLPPPKLYNTSLAVAQNYTSPRDRQIKLMIEAAGWFWRRIRGYGHGGKRQGPGEH